jgi:glucose-1-phosphate thymidylyltransferase
VGFRSLSGEEDEPRSKVVCQYLLEKMSLAGVTKTFIVLRAGKWDIPAYLGDGTVVSRADRGDGDCVRPMHLAYLMMRLPYGAPFTIDQAYPFVQDALIVFGFPDILFEPPDAFGKLIDHQAVTQADVVLGLFPSDQPFKMDMVDLDRDGRVRQIVIKPPETHLRYTWIIAVWTPAFTRYLHDYLAAAIASSGGVGPDKGPELYVGHVIQAAIDDGLQVRAVRFDEGLYLDIGTPDDLVKAVQQGGVLA